MVKKNAGKAHGTSVLDPEMRSLLQGFSDRLRWLSKKKPPAQIHWNIETDSKLKKWAEEIPGHKLFSGEIDNQLELAEIPMAHVYLTGCLLNQDLTGSRLFIYTNRLYLSDLLNEAANPSSNTNPSTTYFLLRTVMETWAVYLDGLASISALPNRPVLQDEESLERFRQESLNRVHYLNWSSFSDVTGDIDITKDLKRDKDDPLKAANVVSIMKRHDHLVENFESVYNVCCHFIHPSSAIRQIYTARTNPRFDLVSIKASTLAAALKASDRRLATDEGYREKLASDGETFHEVFSDCEKILRAFEKKAESRLLGLEKKQAKTNKKFGQKLARSISTAVALPCFCGSKKNLDQCCATL